MYKRIKELREKKGLTEKEVADYLGCSTAAYRKIENGESKISTLKCVKLVYLFDTSFDYLADITDEQNAKSRVPYEEWLKKHNK